MDSSSLAFRRLSASCAVSSLGLQANSCASTNLTVVNNYIGGKHVPPSTGRYETLINCATAEPHASIAISGAKDVDAAVRAAVAVFPAWNRSTVKNRVQFIFKFRELVLKNMDELSNLIVREHGKTKSEAIGEIQKGLETVEWASSLPQLVQGKILEVSAGVYCHEVREPMGVVASIMPFNFPFMVPMWTIPIALAAGNCVIVKPSEKVPLTLSRTMDLFKEAGVPDGVVQLVIGKEEVVNAICDHRNISAVSFVGSSRVAELVAKRCRGHCKRALALGAAKNHLVALPDCNIDMCSSDIVSSFTGCCGQRCMAASVLVLVKEQKELLDLIIKKAAALKPGQKSGELGPVIDKAAQERILSYINQSEKEGVQVLLDGRGWTKQKGFWVGPTVLLHKNRNDIALREEIFGPVLSVIVANSREEAVEIENSSPFGNAACVYTTVGANADWFTQRFHAGMVGVNIGVPVPREPFSFGGWNTSRYGDLDITGEGGLEFFTKRKKITTKWNPPAKKGHGDWMS